MGAEAGVPATSQLASQTALRQVARFAATYPVYCGHLVLHRLLAFIDVNVFNGRLAFPHVDYERLRGPAVFGLGVVVMLALLPGHERQRTLFLAWPLFFNLPLFLVFFSDDMRHVAPVSASLLVSSIPLLTETGFYQAAWRQRGRAAALAAGLLIAWLGARQLDQALLASDAWRYWTPFLDPAPFAWYLR